MAILKPFRGLRPKKEFVERVASLPYDVINTEEAQKLAEGNPYSFLHVVRPEIDLDSDIDLYDDRVYKKAYENFKKLIDDGILIQDENEYLYIYELEWNGHIQRGILGCASVDDYINDVIKKHELTRKEKEDDRTRHVKELNANAGPVFLTYKALDEIDNIVNSYIENNQPEYNFVAEDGIRHTLWIIKEGEIIEKLSNIFNKKIPVLYVADGHHRSASAARVGVEKRKENPNYTGNEEFNYFLAVFFPHNQLKILDYNRVVKDLNNKDQHTLLNEIKDKFEVEKVDSAYRPEALHYFGMYLDGQWYKLKAKDNIINDNDPVESLDVSILQKNILTPILGIGDPRIDKRIHFVGGIRGLEELERLVDSGEYAIAFSMYPTTINQLMSIADANKLMPPKSTWFEPKLRSGLVIHLLD